MLCVLFFVFTTMIRMKTIIVGWILVMLLMTFVECDQVPSIVTPAPGGFGVATTTERAVNDGEDPPTRYEQGLEDYDEETETLAKEGPTQVTSLDIFRDILIGVYELKTAESIELSTDVATSSDDKSSSRQARGMETARVNKGQAFNGYYDFVINEGSYKFWAAFQLATAVLLIYSAFAALYYAKATPVHANYDYDDYYFKRRALDASPGAGDWAGLGAATFQRIMDAISKKKVS